MTEPAPPALRDCLLYLRRDALCQLAEAEGLDAAGGDGERAVPVAEGEPAG